MEHKMTRKADQYDIYQGTDDPSLRMATEIGGGLPGHVDPADWELMPSGASDLYVDMDEDIEARGFCFYQLVSH
jgi:hypothetical protein